jgi:hypothetical protein
MSEAKVMVSFLCPHCKGIVEMEVTGWRKIGNPEVL